MALQKYPIESIGTWGVNLQEAKQLLRPEWLTKTEGVDISLNKQLTARGGLTAAVTGSAPGELLRVFNYITAAGAETLISSSSTKIYKTAGDLSAVGNQIQSTTAPTAGFWKFLNFNGKVLGFQKSHTPVRWSGAGSFTDIVAASGTLPTGDAAHAAFGRVWAVRSDLQTVGYSALLDETKWAAADGGGTIDMRNIWTTGMDYVTAIGSIGSNLVVFGRKHIVVFTDGQGSTLGIDPTQMYVVDVIAGTGCVSRDTVVEVGEGDLLFLSEVGVQSLGRVIQSKDNPLIAQSWQIGDWLKSKIKQELSSQSNSFDDVRGFTAVYLPHVGQYWLIHNFDAGSIENVYVFHLNNKTQDDQGRDVTPIMFWQTSVLSNIRAAVVTRGHTVYVLGGDGTSNLIYTYDAAGAFDNGVAPIPVDIETANLEWPEELIDRNKTFKMAQVYIDNPSAYSSVTYLKYGTDYTTALTTMAANASSETATANVYDPSGDVEGQHFKVGVKDAAFGGKAILRVDLYFQPGRIAFHHNRNVSGVSPTITHANSGLQPLIAIADNNTTASCVATSTDGSTWTARTAIQKPWKSVCYSQALHLAVAVSTNDAMRSSDGITWTNSNHNNGGGWLSVCWSPYLGLFAAVGSGLAGQRVMTSPDGITWTLRITPAAADRTWSSIIWSTRLGMFIAGNQSTPSGVMLSRDGITWTYIQRYAVTPYTTRALIEGNAYVMAGDDANGVSGAGVLTSVNGSLFSLNLVTPSDGASVSNQNLAYSTTLDKFVMTRASASALKVFYTLTGGTTPGTWSTVSEPLAANSYYLAGIWSSILGKFVFINGNTNSRHTATSSNTTSWTGNAAGMPSVLNWLSLCETEVP